MLAIVTAVTAIACHLHTGLIEPNGDQKFANQRLKTVSGHIGQHLAQLLAGLQVKLLNTLTDFVPVHLFG